MIEVTGICKKYEDIMALNNVTVNIQEGSIFGLVGTNGAGKSTLLRMFCGILKPEEGKILVDGENVFENESAKRKIFYISDDSFSMMMAEWLWEDVESFEHVLALLYQAAWVCAELREHLKQFEDKEAADGTTDL